MTSCCFATVIFEGNMAFFPEFLASLQAQTDSDFTLLLFNDGVTNVNDYLEAFPLPYKIISVSGTIANVRQQMLEYLANSAFEHTVFGDTDDFFAPNRVSVSKKLLKECLVVGQDVCLVNENGNVIQAAYWSHRPEVAVKISYKNLKHYNLLGLGNTAICNRILPKKFKIPANLIAVDWYLFSYLLKDGIEACFTSETQIYYRQYPNNTIGLKKLTLPRFKKEVAVKLQHYKAMKVLDADFEGLVSRYEALWAKIDSLSEKDITSYIKPQEHAFWWEQVQL